MAERIARLEQLPAADRPDEPTDEPTGLALLRDADRLFTALEARALSQESALLRRESWDELVISRALADAEGWSQPLRVAVARTSRCRERAVR
jgi:hypothetical protein